MRSHLKKVINNLSFTFEEFNTLLVRIEGVLNSRPLSPLTKNPNEILPLTPGHLLRGAPITALPEAPAEPPLEEVPFLNIYIYIYNISPSSRDVLNGRRNVTI